MTTKLTQNCHDQVAFQMFSAENVDGKSNETRRTHFYFSCITLIVLLLEVGMGGEFLFVISSSFLPHMFVLFVICYTHPHSHTQTIFLYTLVQ